MTTIKHRAALVFFMFAALLATGPTHAVDFICAIPQVGELFIDTQTGNVTKGADEVLKVEVATESSHYRFEFKGKKNQFKALINRVNGLIELDDACTPDCWGGPIFGTCTPVKAKF